MGHGIPMGGLTGFLILVVLGIVVFRLIKGLPEDKGSNSDKSAKEILDERYAKGELSSDEYLEQKKNMES